MVVVAAVTGADITTRPVLVVVVLLLLVAKAAAILGSLSPPQIAERGHRSEWGTIAINLELEHRLLGCMKYL